VQRLFPSPRARPAVLRPPAMSPSTPNDGQDNTGSSGSVQDDEIAQRTTKEQANAAAAAA